MHKLFFSFLFFFLTTGLFAQDFAFKTVEPIKYRDGDLITIQFGAEWCPSCHLLKDRIKAGILKKRFNNRTVRQWIFIDIDNVKAAEQTVIGKARPFFAYPTTIKYRRVEGVWTEINRFEGDQSDDFVKQWLEMDKQKPKKTSWL